MNNRDCEHCTHHTERGCSSWSCEFEARMTEEEIRADERAKTIDEFYKRLLNYKSEINTANYPWNYIELVVREMKGGANE